MGEGGPKWGKKVSRIIWMAPNHFLMDGNSNLFITGILNNLYLFPFYQSKQTYSWQNNRSIIFKCIFLLVQFTISFGLMSVLTAPSNKKECYMKSQMRVKKRRLLQINATTNFYWQFGFLLWLTKGPNSHSIFLHTILR